MMWEDSGKGLVICDDSVKMVNELSWMTVGRVK